VSEQQRLLFLYTGGTLSMVHEGDPGHLVPSEQTPDLLRHVPSLAQVGEIHGRVVTNVDSSDLTPKAWTRLGQAIVDEHDNYDGFVVVHGTDTMAFTACALSFMLSGDHKPIVFTGSQRPLAEPRTDARVNLVHSAICATMGIREVGLYFGSHLFRGNRATKTSVNAYDAFASPNYPPLVELGVDIDRVSAPLNRSGPLQFEPGCATEISVLSTFPGMNPSMLDSLVSAGSRAIVLRGFGEGNLPVSDWPEAITRVTDAGVHVLVASQCRTGSSRPGRYAGSDSAEDAGALFIGDMTGEAAVVKAMCLLGRGLKGDAFRTAFIRPMAGELTSGSAGHL